MEYRKAVTDAWFQGGNTAISPEIRLDTRREKAHLSNSFILYRGRKIDPVEFLERDDRDEKLIVTKGENGTYLAMEKAEFERELHEALATLSMVMVDETGHSFDHLPQVIARMQSLDGPELWDAITKQRLLNRKKEKEEMKKKEEAEAKKAKEQKKPPLDPKELNQKTRENKKLEKQVNKEDEPAITDTPGSPSEDDCSNACPDAEEEPTTSKAPGSIMETIRVMVEKLYGFDD